MKGKTLGILSAGLCIVIAPVALRAEPYLAVRTGAKCIACHVNPTGGGKRNEFGATYGQTALPETRLDLATGKESSEPAVWTGKLNGQFGIGTDLRANARATFTPNTDVDAYAFDPIRSQVYLEVTPIANRLTIYLDERVSPGTATNRETYAMLWLADRSAYLKAGRMFVPFGLRIEDDTAFIRLRARRPRTRSSSPKPGG